MISRYNQHSPLSTPVRYLFVVPEQVRLVPEKLVNVTFVFLACFRDTCDAKKLTQVRAQCLDANFGKELVQLLPAIVARRPESLG